VLARYSPTARNVVTYAQDEARFLGHPSVGTEHILLGLMHEDVPTARLLTESGVFFLEARGVVSNLVGAESPPRTDDVPFTPRAKKVLERAMRDALAQGFAEVHPEHLLVAVLDEDETAGAAMILRDLVVDLDDLRTRTKTQLAGQAPQEPEAPEARPSVTASFPPGVPARFADLFLGVVGFAIGLLTGWLIWGWS
jgi:ATP-dependent Clp protease ATP-binding subunit ClpA